MKTSCCSRGCHKICFMLLLLFFLTVVGGTQNIFCKICMLFVWFTAGFDWLRFQAFCRYCFNVLRYFINNCIFLRQKYQRTWTSPLLFCIMYMCWLWMCVCLFITFYLVFYLFLLAYICCFLFLLIFYTDLHFLYT